MPLETPLTTWYIATRAGHVLVNAPDEEAARREALPGLIALYAGVRDRLRGNAPLEIRTIRPATPDEIALWNWHHARVAHEAARGKP